MPKYACGSLLSVLFWIGLSSITYAQVTSDSSLSTTVISTDGLNFTVENGDRAGNNLFHSFDEFSIPSNGSAVFNNATDIDTIFNRVTGNNVSNLQGSLSANGTANVFLMNPAGMILGEGATLNIGGSFVGTTAETIVFDDGVEFSATDRSSPPLLTISSPTGLQFGANATDVDVQSATLTVPSQKTLSLTGANVTLTNGTITTEQGRVELGSVAASGQVALRLTNDGFTLGYENISTFGDIRLNQASSIDVSGEGAGYISLQGQVIGILDDSFIRADTNGPEDGGRIILNAAESVVLLDTDTSDSAGTNGIFAQVLEESTGKGADVTIETGELRLANASTIFVDTFSAGDTGNISIRATDVILTDGSSLYVFIEPDATGNGGDIILDVDTLVLEDASQIGSGIFGAGRGSDITVTALSIEGSGETEDGLQTALITSVVIPGGTGDAGNIAVETEELILREGAQVFTGTFGDGNAGDIDIKATTIELIGESEQFGFSSSILASASQGIPDVTLNQGQGELRGSSGNITIETDTLSIRDGGAVSSSNAGFGDAGIIAIQATDIELLGLSSSITSQTSSDTGGNGGSIQLNTDRLSIQDGGSITAQASGNGNAGRIDIQAAQVDVRGLAIDTSDDQNVPVASSITTSSESEGAAGTVTIVASEVTIGDRGEISVSGTGEGDAGNLAITADLLELDTQGSLQAEIASGNQGNINLDSRLLLLLDNSTITTNASGTATGGNIVLTAPFIIGLNNSDIVANAVEGAGGNISITTQSLFGLQFRDRLTDQSDITVSSEFGVNGTVETSDFNTDPGSGLVELPSSLVDSSAQIAQRCASNLDNTFIATGRGGFAASPLDLMAGDRPWVDLRDLSTFLGNGSEDWEKIDLPTRGTYRQPANSVEIRENVLNEATTWHVNADGHIELRTLYPNQANINVYDSCVTQAHTTWPSS